MHIQRLFIYPIKSLLPVEVGEAQISHTGFKYDRSFILVDGAKKDIESSQSAPVTEHLTIKTLSKLCLFQPSIQLPPSTASSAMLKVRHTLTESEIVFHLEPDHATLRNAEDYTVEIFGTRATGVDMGDEIAAWFSKHLEQSTRLLYIGSGTRDIVAPALIPRKRKSGSGFLSWFPGDKEEELHAQKIQFADAAPLLITTVSSERDALFRMRGTGVDEEDVILRFRSNIHIHNTSSSDASEDDKGAAYSVSPAYAEDHWKTLELVPAKMPESTEPFRLDLVFNTVRCQSLNVDFRTGGLLPPERQLYKLLATDRRINPAFPYKPCFGRYAFAEPFERKIRVGDEVFVKEWVD